MAEKVSVLIAEEEVNRRIKELGEIISKDYEGKKLHLVCVLKGGAYFMIELAKYITVPVVIDFMALSSYGSGTTSAGRVKILKDLDEPVQGKHVLIVEDIVDSGRTLSCLSSMFESREPASIEICTLLDKPSRREIEVDVKYTGFEIPDAFVVGCGLDFDQRYRNLPYVGVIDFE